MEEGMQKDLLANESTPNEEYRPPPYNWPIVQHLQGPQVVNHQVIGAAAPSEVFAREECLAECVRFWWCQTIGWLAKGELATARSLYLAGDYDEAQAAARCANVWSTVGLASGITLVVIVTVAIYFIVAYGIN